MALTVDTVKDVILEELRAKGYAPNPADVDRAAQRIMDEVKVEIEVAAGENKEAALKVAAAARALDKKPPAK